MGVFIKNKSKKIQTNTSSKPELFINPDNSKVVAVENNIPDKRSVKIGVVDKKSTTIEFKKPLVKNVITPPLEIKATVTKKDSDEDIIDVVVKNEEVTKPTANEALIDKNKNLSLIFENGCIEKSTKRAIKSQSSRMSSFT